MPSPSIHDRISTLLSWSTAHHALLHPSVEIYPDLQTGLSFRVKPSSAAPIQPYESIVSLPTSLSLSYLNALHPSSPCFHADFLAQTRPHVVGRLFLVREFLRGSDSFWYPYIQSLPQPDDVVDDCDGDDAPAWALPPFWPEDDAQLLDGTNVQVGVEKIRADVNKEFKDAKELLALYPTSQDDSFGDNLTRTLYQWAYCIFSSRSFRPSLVLSPEQQKALPPAVSTDDFSVLLPLFDIGNHDMTADIRWQLTDGGNCDLKVGRLHRPGDQVFNNYSVKTNAELLLGYGFMVPATEDLHNDYTHVRKRTAGAPIASDEYLISLRPISHPSSLLARSKQSLVIRPTPPLPPVLSAFQHVQHDMVWDIFCTLTKPELRADLIPVEAADAEAAERLRQENFFSGRVEGECRFYLEQTVAIIQHKVLQELERLDETDVEIDGDKDLLTRNQKLALDYRENCRQVLENTLTAIDVDAEE